MLRRILPLSLFVISTAIVAHPNMAPPEISKDFQAMKQLVGTWEGTMLEGKKEVPATVVYELTSAGTAITEKLGPGTPHEMISVYYQEGKTIEMTHYCASGNHPRMTLKKNTGTVMEFEMTGTSGLTSAMEPHMHALTLTLSDPNTLKQEWVSFDKGKKNMTAVFSFKRKI